MLPINNTPKLTIDELRLALQSLQLVNTQPGSMIGQQVPKIPTVQTSPIAAFNWKQKLLALQEEQGKRGLHLMDESNQRNQDIMKKFMEIFNLTPESDKKELIQQSFLPETWNNFGEKRRNTALPLHSIAFLADNVSLEKLKPYLTLEDMKLRGPYGSSLLHMIIAGVDNNAFVGSPAECAKVFLSLDPSLINKINDNGNNPVQYANYVLPRRATADKLAELKIVFEIYD